ncbi:hypothetical protein A2917_00855 [Candidatus Nomurabacteria bacterium RIFCSPLOWO2_01_FULL_42_17]|uniref:ATP synthase subunit delta n=1 Tax=Candidatus Nomurabacteria bacterium RIFCSPLOWO2_01_FULL_42_17 TaxID=1801780 RepID=A0A1F6XLZ0_9BACT|nr:MAG: hypothetical protein A2917_00855 [Candidatus Nomurabacteria bacterium RIFCSPLOWO2_01_FULL_42_17]
MSKVSPKNIAEAIYEATEGKSGASLAPAIKNSVQILHSKRMLGKSEEVLKELQNIFDKKTGTIRAKITTGRDLGTEERKRIESEIKENYKGKSVVSEFFKKEELLGGVRIEVGDEVRDSSYKNQLEKLKNFLMQEK